MRRKMIDRIDTLRRSPQRRFVQRRRCRQRGKAVLSSSSSRGSRIRAGRARHRHHEGRGHPETDALLDQGADERDNAGRVGVEAENKTPGFKRAAGGEETDSSSRGTEDKLPYLFPVIIGKAREFNADIIGFSDLVADNIKFLDPADLTPGMDNLPGR